jgi:hypothetical protein
MGCRWHSRKVGYGEMVRGATMMHINIRTLLVCWLWFVLWLAQLSDCDAEPVDFERSLSLLDKIQHPFSQNST